MQFMQVTRTYACTCLFFYLSFWTVVFLLALLINNIDGTRNQNNNNNRQSDYTRKYCNNGHSIIFRYKS